MATAEPLVQPQGVAKRIVLVWLDGGPSHLETFDPKPKAATEVRGPLATIATKLPGVFFSEGLPRLAGIADQFSIIRSMTSPVGEHNLATNYALSGHIPGGRAAAPAFVLPASANFGALPPLPSHIALPNFNLGGGSKLQGLLPDRSLPWALDTEPGSEQFVSDLFHRETAPNLKRLDRRSQLLTHGRESDASLGNAIDLLTSLKSQQVFDISRESANTRRRYGNKPIGQNCLLARRLLESGVSVVTVNNKGWDTHDNLKSRLQDGYTGAKVPVGLVPSMDAAVASLLEDLESSGLIDETLVVVMGEFGRTPKINSLGGRDHWPRAYSVLLAGAGIRQGTVHGSSDRVGETADTDPVSPADLVATLYHLVGIDPYERIDTPDGQSMVRVPEQATLVRGVLA